MDPIIVYSVILCLTVGLITWYVLKHSEKKH